ncbi:MAG: hypothetical protein KatS3mg002_0292 [Candidatus Woesearchaeota archaeon]|nr:MAG: hypothetical protein KatS3mg002_0292 [Candidatus Woesearchaeota archaeon]
MAYKIPKVTNYEEIMFDAIVDVNGNGTHTTLQSALDAGKRKILLTDGIHTWDLSGKRAGYTWDSTANSSLELYGQSMENTVIKVLADSTTYCIFDMDDTRTYPAVPYYNGFNVISFDRSTGKLTFDTDPSGSISVNDVIKIHVDYYYLSFSHWVTVTAVDSTSITVAEPNYVPLNHFTSGSQNVRIIVLPSGYIKANFICKNLTFHYDSTQNIYFDAWNTEIYPMENCVCENVKFKSTTNQALDFGYWNCTAENPIWKNCIFEDCFVHYRTYLENCYINGGYFNNNNILALKDCFVMNAEISLSTDLIIRHPFSSTLTFRNCWTTGDDVHFLDLAYEIMTYGLLDLNGHVKTSNNYDVYLKDTLTSMKIIISNSDLYMRTREYIGVDTSTSAITLTLNEPSEKFRLGKKFTIKDISGNAGTNNITINASSIGHTIDGQGSIVLNQDYAAVTIVYQGNNQWSIF